MVSFLAKPGWEMPRKSENKNYHFDHFLPEPQQRIEKKQQKQFKKQKKHHDHLFSIQNRLGKVEKE